MIQTNSVKIVLTLFVCSLFSTLTLQSQVLRKPVSSAITSDAVSSEPISQKNAGVHIVKPNAIFNFSRILGQSGWDENRIPIVNTSIPVNANKKLSNIQLVNYNERRLTSSETQVVEEQIVSGVTVSDHYEIIETKSKARDQFFGLVSIRAIRKEGSAYYALTTYTLDYSMTNDPEYTATKGAKASFVANSVLKSGSGSWYKIGVTSTGIYKLDYNFFQEMGVNPNNINPQNIDIYGNGTGMLPEHNSDYRPDDLVQNNILVVGETDGVFNTSDYVLFYAVGPDTWEKEGATYKHVRHAYDDTSYYFINLQNASGGRLVNASTTTASPTHTLSNADDFVFHDVDKEQISKSGKVWLGELFDINLSHSISLTLDGINTGQPATIQTSIVHNSKVPSNKMYLNANGSQVYVENLNTATGQYTVANERVTTNSVNLSGSNVTLDFTFDRGSPSDQAWLNYAEIIYKRSLNASGKDYFSFRDLASVGSGNVVAYSISGINNDKMIWEVTDPRQPKVVLGDLSGGIFSFAFNADSLRTFVMVDRYGNFPTPSYEGTVTNQNLHGLPAADYIIVTPSEFRSQANRLADLHRSENGLTVHVVDIDKIYNEFSSGMVDPTAVRWFMKMFYDRANGNMNIAPKYLLLFGDGSYDHKDRIEDNNDFLPTYQSDFTFNLTESFTADDYFGLLDDGEAITPGDLMDIGVGRFVISNMDQATVMVDKVEHYMKNGSTLFGTQSSTNCSPFETSNNTFGAWRNRMTIIADDEDNSDFVDGAERMRDTVRNVYPEIEQSTIYLDAYTQEVSTTGQRYPDAEEAINQKIERGVNVINYVGHGGETGLSEERAVNLEMINNWSNINKLNLFVSATCEFTRFDDPERVSAGEQVFLNTQGGAIALLTTTRLVWITLNEELNVEFYKNVFDEENGKTLTFGEIIRRTKNGVAGGTGGNNFRNFTLIGDPALNIKLPQYDIRVSEINNVDVNITQDTIQALSEVSVKGEVIDENGNKLSNFNGLVYPTIFDKKTQLSTLGQDVDSDVRNYEEWRNVIYRGKVSVENGDFDFNFIVPKDIDLTVGEGRMVFYADNQDIDAHGYTQDFSVGGIDTTAPNDVTGPNIQIFMNDFSFVPGGVTNTTPNLIVKAYDEHGINTVGNGIGHDITAVIDQNTSKPIVLNDFYEADTNSYKSGVINYPMAELEEGPHTITVKVWDVYNNDSQETIDFVVANDEELAINHVLNYPNPFTTHTEFFFEHNQNCRYLHTQIEVFTVSGKLVKTIQKLVKTQGFRTEGIAWDGRDDFGDKIGRGVYVYRVSVMTEDGETVDKFEKLVILN